MTSLDKTNLKLITDALYESGVTILAGRQNANEIVLSLNVALQLGLCDNKSVAIVTDKISSSELINKFNAVTGNIKTDGVRLGNGTETNWQVFFRNADTLATSRVFVNCQDVTSIDTAVEELTNFVKHAKLNVAVLNLHIFNSAQNAEAFKLYADSIAKVRDFAKSNDCHVIVTTHCDTPFYEWRVLHRLVTDSVQLMQFFDEHGLALNLFDGSNNEKGCDVTYDVTTGRYNLNMTNAVNEELLQAQKTWKKEKYNGILKGNEGVVSCPFSFGVSDRYLTAKTRIMVIGQEAKGHTCDYDKWTLPNMQRWNVNYVESQLGVSDIEKVNNKLFWRFFRALYNKGKAANKDMFLSWNNLDKVTKYIDGKDGKKIEERLDYEQRVELNKPIKQLGSSLLKKEIELSKTNAVVLAVGPCNPYYSSVIEAFGIDVNKYGNVYPKNTKYDKCLKVSNVFNLGIPVFWTYHPRFLLSQGIDDVVKFIIENI